MIRDKLVFNGPCTLTRLVEVLGVSEHERFNVLVMLNALRDDNQAMYNPSRSVWYSDVVLK